MKTFLSPPVAIASSKKTQLPTEVLRILERSSDYKLSIKELLRLLQSTFPLDHILVTFAANHNYQQDECFFLYPGTPAADICLNSAPEQLEALLYAPNPVIHLGNQEDYGTTWGLIRRLFPGKKYFALTLRTIIKGNILFSFSLINTTSASAFDESHATRFFPLVDLLTTFFEQQKVFPKHSENNHDLDRFLPLSRMPGMQEVAQNLWKVARQHCPVLLLGESGTGKEAVCQTLYRASARLGGPFIKVNCGGLPDNLIDSDLFGHERGAFTGALQTRKGIFERAHRGMLLLDEIGELPPQAQAKLLRVLQEGVLERVGGNEEQQIDVRIVAATHRDLKKMVEEQRFRTDLFFRLNVFPIVIPPLRERPEDIDPLVRFLIARFCSRFSVHSLPEPTHANMQSLYAYSWPGNTRELSNAVERAVILWVSNKGKDFAIPLDTQYPTKISPASPLSTAPYRAQPLETLDQAIARHIRLALKQTGGKISGTGGAAELLDVHPNTLRAKMQKLGILS